MTPCRSTKWNQCTFSSNKKLGYCREYRASDTAKYQGFKVVII